MSRLLLAGAIAFAALLAPSAQACTLETCAGTSVVCTRVSCHVCWIKPTGERVCLT